MAVTRHDLVVLRQTGLTDVPDTPLHLVSDQVLITALCQSRAVLSFTLDGASEVAAECIVPLFRVWHQPEASTLVVVREHHGEARPGGWAALGIAFIRDCLLALGVDTVRGACSRQQWTVDGSCGGLPRMV